MSASTAAPLVIGLGELLWDCFEDSRRPGGAPANVAFHSGQLGNRGVVCSRVGADPLGDELIEHLKSHGLSTDWIQRDSEHPTGTVTVDTSRADHPQYVIHETVAWDFLEFSDEIETLMQSAAAVCFGTLAQRNKASRDAIHACLTATPEDCLRVYDVNLRQNWFQPAWIERSIELASIIKLNEEEVSTLAQLLAMPADPRKFAAEIESRFGARHVCVTRGAAGCVLFEHGSKVEAAGIEVRSERADAVGAGDAFTAGLIAARLRGASLHDCAQLANHVGALVAGKQGAMPTLQDEFGQAMRQYGLL